MDFAQAGLLISDYVICVNFEFSVNVAQVVVCVHAFDEYVIFFSSLRILRMPT